MEKQIHLYSINRGLSFRKILFECFKSMGSELPITGGWGYSKEDAIVIDKNDSSVNPAFPFNGVGIEYQIAEKRIYIETIVARPEHDKYSGVNWKPNKQRLVHDNDKQYDYISFHVTALPKIDFEFLKSEYETEMKNGILNFEKHSKKREAMLCHYDTEFWFDITSFYSS